MASYMFLFILAMVFFLTDARPYHHERAGGIKKVKNMMSDDILEEINRVLTELEREYNERSVREVKSYPEFASWTYQQRKFRQ